MNTNRQAPVPAAQQRTAGPRAARRQTPTALRDPKGTVAYLLHLQRTIGNQAVGGLLRQYQAQQAARAAASAAAAAGPLVQRFGETPVTEYELHPGKDAGPMFTSKEIDPEVTGDSKIRYRYHKSEAGDKPALDVADDGTLAIQHTEQEPKEFYAAAGIVATANESLKQVGSWLILEEAGNAIKIGDKSLTVVSPTTNNEDVNAKARDFADFVYHRCINLAMKQIGKEDATSYGTEAVLQKEGGREATAMVTPGDVDAPEANRLGKALAESGTTVGSGEALGAMGGKGKPKGVGKAYGTRLGKGELDESARELGINQHAKARVGEAYATFRWWPPAPMGRIPSRWKTTTGRMMRPPRLRSC